MIFLNPFRAEYQRYQGVGAFEFGNSYTAAQPASNDGCSINPLDLRRLWAPDPPPLGAARTVPVPPGSPEHAFVAARFRESLPRR